ncbi:MAG: acetaldehyde dehydrogenase (acetylating) [Bdellovibrionales bacterium RIFCSPHIGHO2_01_FULL_40_29]|nr:MAG: acetaldehyde dehydrogenase (acetylating) [Bdellovibrionales bacterium RIFCSPHIGHO2_01_FULL_40_29]OFZ34490.1 MAG: acetaldehyde dehydrogenase (acetylating) [Bdellovibrionales bacterium RIFCSPHIGHO2_02_FULL_40_15]
MEKMKIAIIGSGNIGTDLLIKVLRSKQLVCGAFIGRNLGSQGIQKALSLGVRVSADGIDFIKNNPDCCDIVFDATSAASHFEHAPILRALGKFVIDLTPAKIGTMCVPAVNLKESLDHQNVNMITCGGQASIPVAYAIGQTQKDIDYIEVVSAIASKSAGPATRSNLDEYIHTTEEGIKRFSGAKRTKAILNLNPAVPCINMQTTIMAKVATPDIEALKPVLDHLVTSVKRYVPGYEILVGPVVEDGRIFITIRVKGLGDFLPEYAGNLDIINCAAVAMAEEYATMKNK